MSIKDAMYVAYNLCACPGVAMHDMFSVATEASLAREDACMRSCMLLLLHREASVTKENMLCMATPGQAHKFYTTYMASIIDNRKTTPPNAI